MTAPSYTYHVNDHLAIRLEGVSHAYPNGTRALENVTLNLGSEDFTVLIGPSGAGKSTLMRVLNGLVRPQMGRVWIGDTEISHAPERTVRLQRRRIGMVFQSFNLVRRLTALENVLLGCLSDIPAWRSAFHLYSKDERLQAMMSLERVGMADFAWQRSDTLSGGQQQRVGIARALAQRPQLILADEPISALDPKSSEQVMELLRDIQQRDGIAVLTNLHHLDAVREYAGRVIALRRGQVFFDGTVPELSDEITRELYYGEVTSTERSHDAGGSFVSPAPFLKDGPAASQA
jgi:phosphonate transport system ATP-binding protein